MVRLRLPALRERPEDIPALLDHFSSRCAERYGRPVARLDDDVRRQLGRYPWRGNVRELLNWVERLYAAGLEAGVLVDSLLADADELAPKGLLTLQEAERQAIARALDATGSNRSEAARILNVNRGTLLRKISQHGVS